MRIETYGDLLKYLQSKPEILEQKIQIAPHNPNCDEVLALEPCFAIGTVDEMFEHSRYIRSSNDNSYNPDEVVILSDWNPFGEDGATSYLIDFSDGPENETEEERIDRFLGKNNPQYGLGYKEETDWTGPAQKIFDSKYSFNRDEESNELDDLASHRITQMDSFNEKS